MKFTDFALSPTTLAGIAGMGFERPMPIQAKAIPTILEGEDLIACAQTGTGKTAAYLVPIMDSLLDVTKAARFRPRALVMVPTRELAQQVCDHFEALTKGTRLRAAAFFGGVDIGAQERALQQGVELLVATPGRLLEHLRRGGLRFRDLNFLVIDEADRLFDAGFLPDLRKIVDELPERRQTLLFSATMPTEMEQFAHAILKEPQRIQIGLVAPAEAIEESLWPVPEHQKVDLLKAILAEQEELGKVMVFVRQRARAREVTPILAEATGLPTAELHAELTQKERNETLAAFRAGTIRLLVATDVAARGLDIEDVTHVVNYDVPNTPDDYIHRVGRTARVDRGGAAITLVSPKELALATGIEAVLRRPIRHGRMTGFPYDVPEEPEEVSLEKPRSRRGVAQSFTERPTTGGKKENPFTKSGRLKKKFQGTADREEQSQKSKKRQERRFVNKKLPHQKKH